MLKILSWTTHLCIINSAKYLEYTSTTILIHYPTSVVKLDICEHARVKELIQELGDEYKVHALNAAYTLIAKFLAEPTASFLNLTESLFSMSHAPTDEQAKRNKVAEYPKIVKPNDVGPS